jgi:acyl-homoserine lactone acylase PvdQ
MKHGFLTRPAVICLRWLLTGMSPEILSGRRKYQPEGPNPTVEIIRDRWGIPHSCCEPQDSSLPKLHSAGLSL